MTYSLVRLGDCCEVISGATPKTDVAEYWDGDIVWITPKDIALLNDPVVVNSPDKITQAGFDSCSTQMLQAGAVLVSSRAPIGHVAIAGRDLCTNQGFKSLVPGADVDTRYLFYCMKFSAQRLAALGNGATFKEVSKAVVEDFKIPLPSNVDEQRRIAATLDKADSIRKKRREALMLADEFLHSTFFDLFGDPINNERRWTQSTLGEIAPGRGEIVDGPFGSSLKPDQYVDQGVRVIRNFNVRPGYFDPSAYKYVTPEKFEEIRRSEVREGDLLLSTKGTVGNVCLMPYLDGPSVLSATGTVRIRINSPHVDSVFLMHQMLTPQYQRHIEKSQSGAVQQYLNLSGIRDLPIILPPMELQRKFSEITIRKDMLSANLQCGFQEAETLFASLAHRAFSGKL